MARSGKRIPIAIALLALLLAGCQAAPPPTPPPTPAPTAIPTSSPTSAPAASPTITLTPLPGNVRAGYGLGDPYFPELGNPGYDVQNYVISLDVDPETGEISGKTSIQAEAADTLRSFNLDFQKQLKIDKISVNGTGSIYSRVRHELIITPDMPLQAGDEFTVEVSYHGVPHPVKTDSMPSPYQVGWSRGTSKAINVLSEPDGASTWFPANDHPLDKALYRFEITVPRPWVVAASGNLIETTQEGDKTRYVWEMDKPMASYLASVDIDHYRVEESAGPAGVRIRNYIPVDADPALTANLKLLPEMIAYFSGLYGPYPFDAYGVLLASSTVWECAYSQTQALEVQSLSVHCPDKEMLSEATLAHELAHQWFGDSVSLKRWQDIWLKEGLATYSEWLWRTRGQGVDAVTAIANEQKNSYQQTGMIGQPSPNNIYSNDSYTGGALVAHALRLKVGDEAFFKILRTYQARYRYGNAGTQEFIAVAEEVSGQDLSSFFDSWLMQTTLPEWPAPSK